MTELGQTTQITVTATLGNGETKDVSTIDDYTTYRNSNPAIVSVGQTGLVTALSKGMAFITAVNEGVTSVVQIDVSPGDLLTEVRGFAVDSDGNPVADAIVSIPGLAGETMTAADGSFSLGSVATEFGFSSVVVETMSSLSLFGVSLDLRIVPGGITDAGIITLISLCDVVGPCIDTDGDWIPDHLEPALLLDPENPDSDGNGINDGDEDFNNNGVPNRAELLSGGFIGSESINEGNHEGEIGNGDLARYQFRGGAGEIVIFRAGELSGSSFNPWIRLVGPDGTLIEEDQESSDAFVSASLPEDGLYTVIIGSWFAGRSGSYNLRYLNLSQDFVVPEGDEGGPLTNGADHAGVTPLGDEDVWTFEGGVGEAVILRAVRIDGGANFDPHLRLYGPDGRFIDSHSSDSEAFLSRTLETAGTYRVTVSSRLLGNSGSYTLRYENSSTNE